MLDALLGSWPTLAAIGGGIVALIAAYFGIKRSGRKEAEAKQERANADAIVRGSEIRDRVRAGGADAARDELRERFKQPRN